MDADSLADAIRSRLAILIDVAPDSIRDDTPFADLDVDSLMLLELVAIVEQHIGFELAEQDLSKFRTIADVRRYIDAIAAVQPATDR